MREKLRGDPRGSHRLTRKTLRLLVSYERNFFTSMKLIGDDREEEEIEVTSWLVSADEFSSRVARGANERVSAANE